MPSQQHPATFVWVGPDTRLPDDRMVYVITREETRLHGGLSPIWHWYIRMHAPGARPVDIRRLNGHDPACADLIDWINGNKEGATDFFVLVARAEFDALMAALSAPRVHLQVLQTSSVGVELQVA